MRKPDVGREPAPLTSSSGQTRSPAALARNVHERFRRLGFWHGPLGPPKLDRRTSRLRRSFWDLSLDVLSKKPAGVNRRAWIVLWDYFSAHRGRGFRLSPYAVLGSAGVELQFILEGVHHVGKPGNRNGATK